MIEVNLDQLDMLLAEKRYNADVARLWEVAIKHTSERVHSFLFMAAYLTTAERAANDNAREKGRPPLFSIRTHLNAVRLMNEDVVVIPMTERPDPPPHMKVTIR